MVVKSLRKKHDWSQEQLAQLSGLNIRTIQRVEKGESVGLETLKSLAAVFEVDVSELRSKSTNDSVLDHSQLNKETLNDTENREQKAKAEVKSKKEFYILVLFLLGIFIFFFVPNYNQGENLGALISTGICFIMIIVAHGVSVFQPFGENWEKKKVKQVMEKYEKEH